MTGPTKGGTMFSIYKYPIPIRDQVGVKMPVGASILSAQMQGGQLCLWALVVPKNPVELKTFRIIGTGHDIDSDELARLKFVGTVQAGALAWHVWQKFGADFG